MNITQSTIITNINIAECANHILQHLATVGFYEIVQGVTHFSPNQPSNFAGNMIIKTITRPNLIKQLAKLKGYPMSEFQIELTTNLVVPWSAAEVVGEVA